MFSDTENSSGRRALRFLAVLASRLQERQVKERLFTAANVSENRNRLVSWTFQNIILYVD